jgi:membrane-associated protein
VFEGESLKQLILTVSYLGVFGIVFAETGLLAGFLLPGDSLLITAGLLAAEGVLSLPLVILACAGGSIIGDQAGYWIGRRFGPRVFSRPNSRFFKPEYVERAESYFKRYGPLTVVIARFIPIIRTMSATTAGVSRMPYQVFLAFSILGGLLWGAGVPYLGYALGKAIPDLDKYILFIIGGVIVVSVIPIALKVVTAGRKMTRPQQEP